MFKCVNCEHSFISQSNLNVHRRTAKYCLASQNKQQITHECRFCTKTYSTASNLKTHLAKCAVKKDHDTKCDMQEQWKVREEQYQAQLKEKELELYEAKMKAQETEIAYLKSQLEKRMDDITDIARQTNLINDDDDNEEDSKVPQNVSQQLDLMEDSDVSDYMMTLSQLTLNNVTITSRHPDHYVNATQLCQAGGKLFKDWHRLESTKELIAVLSSEVKIPPSLLVESKKGQSSIFRQGSWVHPDLAIQLAQWISPAFALQVSRWVRSLFSDGNVSVDLSLIKEQQQRIEKLETVCLSKRKREKYEGQFFIYLLTTDDHLKRRTYIVGKAKNLENRLSVYNKTCDHTVVYYRECGSEENMSVVETMVLNRLTNYREQSNRDRVILPDGKDICLFQSVIDDCVQFVVSKK